jgi:DNA polymerase I
MQELNLDLPDAEWLPAYPPEHVLTELGNSVNAQKLVALDTETTGLDKETDHAVYWSLGWEVDGRMRRACLHAALLESLAPVLRKERRWLLANAKFDASMIENTVGIALRGDLCDVLVMHGLLYEDMEHGLKEVVYQLFNWRWASFEQTFGKVDKKDPTDSYARRLRQAERTDLQKLVQYASLDAYGTYRVYVELKKRLEAVETSSIFPDQIKTLWDYFEKTEMPFTRVLWNSERLGLPVDLERLRTMRTEVQAKEQEELRLLWGAAGRPLNPQNANELADYFFNHKGYDPWKFTKGGASGQQKPSVDKDVLDSLFVNHRDEVAKRVIECKSLHNVDNTFLAGIERKTDRFGRVHASFNQNIAVTGRLSSNGPNLQNVKHPDNDPFGIRSVFKAKRGNKLIVADYSALEMMLLAEAARDMKLISIFEKGLDIHMGNASLVFGISYEEIAEAKQVEKMVKAKKLPPSAMTQRVRECLRARQFVKVISYGLNYGMKAKKLAANLDISVQEAEALMERYMATYPAVMQFFDETNRDLYVNQYVCSMMGRMRRLPEIRSPRPYEQWRAGRQGANFIIQGSAAECAKMAMLRLHESDLMARTGYMLLLQVHDELMIEGPEETAEEACKIMRECMEHPLWGPLLVPLKASPTVADSWQDAK